MARTPNTPAQAPDKIEVLPALAQRHADTQDALTLAETQLATRVRAVAAQLKYEGSLQPDALENGARDAIRRINLGVFELGGYLLMLRETFTHGEFLPAMERLGLEPYVAQRYMQVTKRFANTTLKSHLAPLGKTKLLEMLVLDNEQMEELELTGQTGDLKLDDVAGMSVSELRKALRDSRLEKQAVEKLVETKNKQIDKLQLIQAAEPNEKLGLALEEVSRRAAHALGSVRGELRLGFEVLAAFENGGDNSHRGVMKGYLDDLQREIDILRGDYFLLADAA